MALALNSAKMQAVYLVSKQKVTQEDKRPLLFEEPLDQRKPVMFTRSQVAEIQKAAGPNVDFSTYVRTAALEKARGAMEVASSSMAEIKAMFQEAIGNFVRLKINDRDKADLILFARKHGFEGTEALLEAMAARVVVAPREAEKFLYGEVDAEIEARSNTPAAKPIPPVTSDDSKQFSRLLNG